MQVSPSLEGRLIGMWRALNSGSYVSCPWENPEVPIGQLNIL
jgi:hypothetical protein